MKLRFSIASFAAIISLSACDTPAPAPIVAANATPAAETASTRAMSFRAENAGTPVAAQCTLSRPDFDATFETPARINIPVGPDKRATVNTVRCILGTDIAEWTGIPGPETRAVKARFGGTGLFGATALIFGQSEGAVQYFVREGELVTVRGAPAP